MEFIRKYLVYIVLVPVFILALFQLGSVSDPNREIDSNKVNLYFFYGDGCPHCAKEEVFLDNLEEKYDEIDVHRYETWYNSENARVLDELRKEMGFRSGVPALIVGEEAVVGYSSYEITGKKIEDIVTSYIETGCNDLVAPYFGVEPANDSVEKTCEHSCEAEQGECEHDCGCSADMEEGTVGTPDTMSVPFFGEINVKGLALPIFTIVIAAADGFNPCAMWVLLFLISLLLGMEDKKRMWILGLSFIGASALVYYLLVFTWLQIFLLVGMIIWIRLAIGLLAVGSGAYHLKEYWDNKEDATCKVTDSEKRKETFKKLRDIVKKQSLWLALGGIVLLAAAVNMVELLCSAGFPQAFTQVLALKDLPWWQNQLYLLLYIFIFMLDDLFIFFLAMKTMELKGISSKYSKWANLVGGILILIIGILLIFKPEWIMFG